MGNHLNSGHRDEPEQVKKQDRVHTSGEQQTVEAGEHLPAGNPVMQLQSAVGNRAMLQMLKNGSLGPVKANSTGNKLPDTVKTKMESSFGTDFSDVTVHQSPDVAAMGARAFAQQNRVHFAPGQYSPASKEGQSLLGHELAHVVQQRQGRVARPTHKNQSVVFNPRLEQEADCSGERAANGIPVGGSLTMQIGPSPTQQFDNSAPVQGFFNNGAEEEEEELMGPEANEEEGELEE